MGVARDFLRNELIKSVYQSADGIAGSVPSEKDSIHQQDPQEPLSAEPVRSLSWQVELGSISLQEVSRPETSLIRTQIRLDSGIDTNGITRLVFHRTETRFTSSRPNGRKDRKAKSFEGNPAEMNLRNLTRVAFALSGMNRFIKEQRAKNSGRLQEVRI